MTKDHPQWAEEYCKRHDLELPNADWDDTNNEWRERHVWAGRHGPDEREVDVTEKMRPGRRVSGNVEIIMLEAKMAANGKELQNPAVPVGAIQEEVRERLDQEELDPAWEVCERIDYPPLP